MKRWASLGGKERSRRLAPARRAEIARLAVETRWRRRRLALARRNDPHEIKERASLRYHQEIAARIVKESGPILARAAARLARWSDAGNIHPAYADQWRRILDLSPREIARAIAEDSERGRALRQNTLFPGELPPGTWERWLREETSGAGGGGDAPA